MSDQVLHTDEETANMIIGAARILSKGVSTRSESDSLTKLLQVLRWGREARAALGPLREQTSRAEAELGRYREMVSAYEAQLAPLEAAHAEIVRELRKERDQFKSAAVGATAAREIARAEHQRDFELIRKREDDAVTELDEALAKQDEAESELVEANTELEKLRALVSEGTDAIEQYTHALNTAGEEMSALRAQLADGTDALAQASKLQAKWDRLQVNLGVWLVTMPPSKVVEVAEALELAALLDD